jgi:acetylglutamate kinase
VTLVVVKIGGAALVAGELDLSWIRPGTVVVHGGGPRISATLAAAGIVSEFVGGRRRTPPEAMPHVVRVLREENGRVCGLVGAHAVGLLGHELGLEADPVPELGCVGELRPSIPSHLWSLLGHDVVPVIAPLARGPLNVNADDAAAALAIGLRADRLVFVSDVPGVLVGGAVARSFCAADLDANRPALTGGIVPKVRAGLATARAGVAVEIGATSIVA